MRHREAVAVAAIETRQTKGHKPIAYCIYPARDMCASRASAFHRASRKCFKTTTKNRHRATTATTPGRLQRRERSQLTKSLRATTTETENATHCTGSIKQSTTAHRQRVTSLDSSSGISHRQSNTQQPMSQCVHGLRHPQWTRRLDTRSDFGTHLVGSIRSSRRPAKRDQQRHIAFATPAKDSKNHGIQ